VATDHAMHFFDRSSFPVRVFCDIDEWQVGFKTCFRGISKIFVLDTSVGCLSQYLSVTSNSVIAIPAPASSIIVEKHLSIFG